MDDVVKALSAIVSASWVDSRSAAKVKAFLEADGELSLKQPQAASYNYESKSGGTLEWRPVRVCVNGVIIRVYVDLNVYAFSE